MISIIIPLYNKRNSIIRTINSVLNQSYSDFEVIVINDGSTDNSAELVSEIKDNRIKLFNKENGGVSSARNKGVQCSTMDYIYFLDADDVLEDNALEIFYNNIKKEPSVNMFVANFYIELNGIREEYCLKKCDGFLDDPYELIYNKQLFIRMGSFLIKRNKYLNKYSFNESYSHFEDIEYIFNFLDTYKIYYIHTPIMSYQRDFSELSAVPTSIYKSYISCLCLKKGDNKYKKRILAKLYLGILVELCKNRRYSDFFKLLKFRMVTVEVFKVLIDKF